MRDVYLPLGARGDVDAVVAGAVVADELDGGGEGGEQLGVDEASDGEGGEGAEDGDDAVEGAGLGFLDEIGAVVGFGSDEVGVFGEGFPVFLGRLAVEVSIELGQRLKIEVSHLLVYLAEEQDLRLLVGCHDVLLPTDVNRDEIANAKLARKSFSSACSIEVSRI